MGKNDLSRWITVTPGFTRWLMIDTSGGARIPSCDPSRYMMMQLGQSD